MGGLGSLGVLLLPARQGLRHQETLQWSSPACLLSSLGPQSQSPCPLKVCCGDQNCRSRKVAEVAANAWGEAAW